jgi:hypothetical protein
VRDKKDVSGVYMQDEPTSKKPRKDLVQAQEEVAKRKAAAFENAVVGQLVKFIGARGETWLTTRTRMTETQVSTLHFPYSPARIGLVCGTGFKKKHLRDEDTVWLQPTIFNDISRVVVVDDIGSRCHCPFAFGARLFGTRLADAEWVRSRMSSGHCLEFPGILHERTHIFFVSRAFREEYPQHSSLLDTATGLNKNYRERVGKTTWCRIHDVDFNYQMFKSELSKFPQRTYAILGTADVQDNKFPQRDRVLSLDALSQLLGKGVIQCK